MLCLIPSVFWFLSVHFIEKIWKCFLTSFSFHFRYSHLRKYMSVFRKIAKISTWFLFYQHLKEVRAKIKRQKVVRFLFEDYLQFFIPKSGNQGKPELYQNPVPNCADAQDDNAATDRILRVPVNGARTCHIRCRIDFEKLRDVSQKSGLTPSTCHHFADITAWKAAGLDETHPRHGEIVSFSS